MYKRATQLALIASLAVGCRSDGTSPVDAVAPRDRSVRDASADQRRPVDGARPDARFDAGVPLCATDAACGTGRVCVGKRCVDALRVWPNGKSRAASDPWLSDNHAALLQLRPRVLALNFVNNKTNAQMLAHLATITGAITEASRPRGYRDKGAAPLLKPEIAYSIDLRDKTPPAGWKYNNSTLYPRESPKEGYWSFDYEKLWSKAYAAHYEIADPKQPGVNLDLCELVERGLVHEVWIYGDAAKPDVTAAEILEYKPYYDANRKRRAGVAMNRCAGNGCFDAEDTLPAACTRTLRIAWVNNTRGAGCFMESLSHGVETIGARRTAQIPYLAAYFPRFSGTDLDTRHGLPFSSWYACSYSGDCLGYPTRTSVKYTVAGKTATVASYDPVCGSAHFMPNGRRHYDLTSPHAVLTSCEAYRQGSGGKDKLAPFTVSAFAAYKSVAPDCMGPFLVYWWQSFPGPASQAKDASGQPMLAWLPFLYY